MLFCPNFREKHKNIQKGILTQKVGHAQDSGYSYPWCRQGVVVFILTSMYFQMISNFLSLAMLFFFLVIYILLNIVFLMRDSIWWFQGPFKSLVAQRTIEYCDLNFYHCITPPHEVKLHCNFLLQCYSIDFPLWRHHKKNNAAFNQPLKSLKDV